MQPDSKKVVYINDGTFEKGEVPMDDKEIVELYWQRNEQAIKETADKYGAYCRKISLNILSDLSDSEENVNDAYMQAWLSIPPHKPDSLMAFLGKLTRNLALNRYKAMHAKKRLWNQFAISLDELSDCTPSNIMVEQKAEIAELGKSINSFLYSQKEDIRNVFICRYFYCDSVEEISDRFGYSQSKIKSMLMRARIRLKSYLKKEGYYEE
jgi:RNA polymerase sigma factor, sigma-70 family